MMTAKKPASNPTKAATTESLATAAAVHEAGDVSGGVAVAEQALSWLRAQLNEGANLHTDSRAVQAGDGFLAYRVDGADNRPHIIDAIARGAAAVLVQANTATAVSTVPSAQVPTLDVPDLAVLAGVIAGGWYGEPSKAMRMVAVTGTNGKTSTTQWMATALHALGTPTALVGTLGAGFPDKLVPTGFTTPNAAQLQYLLADLRMRGARAVAMEVSSHALHQGRVNGTAFDVAVFTNLTQDHLDYHHTMAAYEAAKARLFDWPGLRFAVINQDDAAGRRLLRHLAGSLGGSPQRRLQTLAYSVAGLDDTDITGGSSAESAAEMSAVTSPVGVDAPVEPRASVPSDYRLRASDVHVVASGRTAFTVSADGEGFACACRASIEVATLGVFNVANLLAVLGTLLAVRALDGVAIDAASFKATVATLSALPPVPGRMQRIGGRAQADEPLVIIDYAHTPDALEKTLLALQPVAAARGGAVVVMFGCGGDRDTAKRPLMGAIASRLANAVVLTSDNPRSENAAAIIDQIAAGVPAAVQADTVRRIEDRASAILQSIRTAKREDVVLLAGKGHEATQEIMGKKRPFSDQDHAQLALAARATHLRGEAS